MGVTVLRSANSVFILHLCTDAGISILTEQNGLTRVIIKEEDMTLPADSLITFTLEKMNARLAANPLRNDRQVRSGLVFTGNVHDAIPRRLLLDQRLSPLIRWAG